MIKLKLLFCAKAVIRDAATNEISVFGIIEEITPAGLPLLVPSFAVLAVFERDEGDPEVIGAGRDEIEHWIVATYGLEIGKVRT